MNRENSSAIRHGVLALAWVCAVSWTCAPCGESEALLKDEPRYEVHPLIDDQCNRIAWYVKESTIHKQEDEAADQCNVWRMRARASLCSYRRNSNAISLAVRLTVNPTIRNMIREGCFVERIVGAESQDFTFECRVGDYRQSLALVSNTISPVAGKNGTMTMCAYGKEPLLKEGSTLVC